MSDKLLRVLDIRIALPSNHPVLLLLEETTKTLLRIWIGTAEASAIALAQQQIEPPRPMTHHLLVNSLEVAGKPLDSVRISQVDDDVYYAELHLSDGSIVDARVSDAVALAVIAEAPVFGAAEVLDVAGVDAAEAGLSLEEQMNLNTVDEVAAEESVSEFIEFLEQVTPEDFMNGDEDTDPESK